MEGEREREMMRLKEEGEEESTSPQRIFEQLKEEGEEELFFLNLTFSGKLMQILFSVN